MNGDTYFFYNHHKDLDSAISMISAYLRNNPGVKASILGLYFNEDLEKTFQDYVPNKFSVELEKTNPSVFNLKVTKKYSLKGKKYVISGKALLLKITDKFTILVSIENLKEFKSVFLQLISHYNLELSRVYLDSKVLESLLDILGENPEIKIIAKRIVAYERKIQEKGKYIKKSEIIYTSENYKESFEEAINKDQFIDKIDFSVLDKEKNYTIFNGHLSREGLFRVDSGFRNFYDTVILGYKNHSLKLFKLLVDRQRKKEEMFKVKPLEIEFESGVFKERSDNYKLIDALKLMNHSTLSCYHSNPYLNLSVLDYIDGSTAEIWVLEPKKMIIVPQTKTTSDFLSRLIKHIFENFREGEIKEYTNEKTPTII